MNTLVERRYRYRRTTILAIVLPILRLELTLFITVRACVVAGLLPSVLSSSTLLPYVSPFLHRREAFGFFVYVVILPLLQADFGVVSESGGILICIF